jgi:hypothetical protein
MVNTMLEEMKWEEKMVLYLQNIPTEKIRHTKQWTIPEKILNAELYCYDLDVVCPCQTIWGNYVANVVVLGGGVFLENWISSWKSELL